MTDSMRKILSCVLLVSASLLVGATASAQSSFDLHSPDKRIEVRVRTIPQIRYDILLNGRPLLEDCTLSLDVDHVTLGVNPKVVSAKETSHDQIIEPPVRQKFAKIRDNYNELRLQLEGNYSVVFRAYNEGAAYRFETTLPQK